MAEPVSNTTGVAFLWKLLGIGGLVSGGVLGAVLMAAFDPPKDRKTMFLQALVAGVSSLVFGPLAAKTLDHFIDFIDLSRATTLEMLEIVGPVYFVIGSLSWGVFAAGAKLRQIIADKGADKASRTIGL
jgi:hypothetical protein